MHQERTLDDLQSLLAHAGGVLIRLQEEPKPGHYLITGDKTIAQLATICECNFTKWNMLILLWTQAQDDA